MWPLRPPVFDTEREREDFLLAEREIGPWMLALALAILVLLGYTTDVFSW